MVDNKYIGDRRKDCRREMDSMKEDITRLYEGKDKSSNFRSQAKICGIIFTLIYIGSFVYTHNHKAESNIRFSQIQAAQEAEAERFRKLQIGHENRLDDIETNIALSVDRYNRLITDIGLLNKRMSSLILVLIEEKHGDGNNKQMRQLYLNSFDPNEGVQEKMP